VIIGEQRLVFANLAFCPKGTVLLKGLNAIPAGYMAALTQHGYTCFACDEEALGISGSALMERDITPSVGADCDLIFAQSAFHRDVIMQRTGASEAKVVVVGNSRFDLLQPSMRALHDREAADIHAEHGDFVLFNTNVGFVHSSWGNLKRHEKTLRKIGWLNNSEPQSFELHNAAVRLDYFNYDVTCRTVRDLAARNPNLKIIVRPHPAEHTEAWGDEFLGIDNVLIKRDGDHIAMILASRLVLHTGCTTGIEAMLLDRPVLTVRAEQEDLGQWRWFASNLLNPMALGAAEAVERVEAFLSDCVDLELERPDERAAARYLHLASFDGNNVTEFIADTILKRISDQALQEEPFKWSPTAPKKMQWSVPLEDYTKRKMSIKYGEIVDRYRELQSCISDATPTLVQQIGDSVFLFERSRINPR